MTQYRLAAQAVQLSPDAGLPRGVSQAVPPMRYDRTVSAVGPSRAARELGILLVVVLAVTLGHHSASYQKPEAIVPWRMSIVRGTRQGRHWDGTPFQRTVRKTRTRSPARKVGGCLFSLILSEVSTESAWIAALGIGTVAPFTDRAFNAGLQ
jgi:hypothetical protein